MIENSKICSMYFIVIVIFIFCTSCNLKTKPIINLKSNLERSYSFFVGGHVYGESGVNNPGVHPPFKKIFPWIKSDVLMKFGFFTGDIVGESTNKNWDEIDRDIAELGMPVYLVAGNHDYGDLFIQRYKKTFYSINYFGDCFIVLDSNVDFWNISGEQLEFLKTTLNSVDQSSNIFIFIHHVVWWENDNLFKDVKIHYGNRKDSVNFWPVIVPLFRQLPNSVYLFAGDIGGNGEGVSYYEEGNLHLTASGMGGADDNFLRIDVFKDQSVDINIVYLDSIGRPFGVVSDFLPN